MDGSPQGSSESWEQLRQHLAAVLLEPPQVIRLAVQKEDGCILVSCPSDSVVDRKFGVSRCHWGTEVSTS